MTRLAHVLLSLTLLVTSAHAHDFWLEPSDATPAADDVVSLHLRLGHPGHAEVFGRNPDHIVRFEAVGPDGAHALYGVAGRDPAARDRMPAAGTVLAVYRSTRDRVDMEPEAFEDYLREEGLERVRAGRRERGETDARGVETYSRCAKALLAVDGRVAPGFDAVVGLSAELVPLRHPLDLHTDEDGRLLLPVRLLVGGEPAADVRVHAAPLDGDHETAEVAGRTDDRGEVVLALPADAGERFVVLAVHGDATEALPAEALQVPLAAAAADTPVAPWESLWASLVLPVGPRAEDPDTGEP